MLLPLYPFSAAGAGPRGFRSFREIRFREDYSSTVMMSFRR